MTPSRLKWPVLSLLAVSIAGNYYAYDAIAPVADMLRSQAGFSQSQIGLLNAVASLPNVVLALVGGILIDRYGAARASFASAALCTVGAVLTAVAKPFGVMVTGRLLFGVGEETLLIALLAGISQWFASGGMALAMSLFFSLARVGSYTADISPSWAGSIYAGGWQPPLWLAAGLTGISLVAATVYLVLDLRRDRSQGPASTHNPEPFRLKDLAQFDLSFWYIFTLNVLFASVFFPFRSTFAIAYFQDAKGLTLQDAGQVNSLVFFAAIFATPFCGAFADRFGRRSALLVLGTALVPVTFLLLGATTAPLWISTALMGVSFSVIPAVIWPSTSLLVAPKRLGTAFGLINVLQNLGIGGFNLAAGALNDAFHAGPKHPQGYEPMMLMFGLVSLVALAATVLLWRREQGPNGHGLDRAAA